MLELFKPKITIEESAKGDQATFTVEPLERGYGITIGNCLRRVLSMALPGAAIRGIKIEGVKHEFSTVPGVREDVADIILNLKELAIKVLNPDEFADTTVTLIRSTPGVISAADIDFPTGIEVMNPDAYICTIEEGATLNMELTVGVGRGYVSAKDNKIPQAPIGYLPIDSLYSPVVAVSYEVESTRVGQSIDYDKLRVTQSQRQDQRGGKSQRGYFSRRQSYGRPPQTVHQPRRGYGFERDTGFARRRQAVQGAQHEHRGTGAFRKTFELLETRGRIHGGRSREEERRRYVEGQEPRQKISGRSHP